MKVLKQLLCALVIAMIHVTLFAQNPVILHSVASPFDDHHYLLLDASSWTEAEAQANAWGANLVAVGDQAEMDFIHDNFSAFQGTGRRLWLGLNDIAIEGVFEWSNGETLTYTDWNAGEPNNSGNEDMVHTLENPPYLWNDINEGTNPVNTYGIVELETCGYTGPDAIISNSVGPDIVLEFTNNGPYTDTFDIWRDGQFYQSITDPAATSWTDTNVCQGRYEYIIVVSDGACFTFTESIDVFHGFDLYASTDPPLPIPNNDPIGVTSVVSITDNYIIQDVDVEVHIFHTWTREVGIDIFHPSTTLVTLKQYVAGSPSDVNHIHTVFDDQGIPFDEDQIPLDIHMQPQGPGTLFDFAGLPIDGDWRLTVTDNDGAETGQLENWSIHHLDGPPCQLTPPSSFSSSSNGPEVTLTWDLNGNFYTDIEVLRNGQLVETIDGSDQQWSEVVQGGPAYYSYQLRCLDNSITPCCVIDSATVGALVNAVDVVWAAEGSGGNIDSATAIADALVLNGLNPAVMPEILSCNCLLSSPDLQRVWVASGTYPDYHCMTTAEGTLLAELIANGIDVYVEGGDVWGFCPQTPFADWDGIGDGVVDGDDTLLDLIGLSYDILDLTGMDAAYNQDQVGSDWTDRLVAADPLTPDQAGISSGAIWQQSGIGYSTGNFYATDDPYGEVLTQSWEFGGYSAEQGVLMGIYLEAIGATGGPPQEIFRRGDVNSDTGVNIADAVRLLNGLFVPGSPQPECYDSADVNDDGSSNVADAVYLLGALFIPGSPNPPPPGLQNCGPDPTDDNLDCAKYEVCS
ncbi:MAG: proprotein convertase P-domain-containing protein [Planctomycetota bacterium]|nr:proprotein convertase P-domain-containing protein [Planctomycetota bacterium]